MQDDLMRDIKDIRLEQERGRLTKFKVWYIIILIIVAAGIAYGMWRYINNQDLGWLGQKFNFSGYTKSQDETDDADVSQWKTYTDTDLGFVFKYPREWDLDVSITKISGSYNRIVLIRANPDVIIDKIGVNQKIEFWVTVYNLNYQNYISKRIADKTFIRQRQENATLTSINGKKIIFETTNFGKKLVQNDLVFPLNVNQTISLSYFVGTKEAGNITNILKSFRFSQ